MTLEQIEQLLKLKKYEKQLIKWWNRNAFLRFTIKNSEDLINGFHEFNIECNKNGNLGFFNIQEMIEYHQNETDINENYELEIKKMGLGSSYKIDKYLLSVFNSLVSKKEE